MPDYPSTTRGLTPEERQLACQRLAYDGIGNTQGDGEKIKSSVALKMAFTDWKVWYVVEMVAYDLQQLTCILGRLWCCICSSRALRQCSISYRH